MTAEILTLGNQASLRKSNFNSSHLTVFYIHGYAEQSTGTSASALKNGKIKKRNE